VPDADTDRSVEQMETKPDNALGSRDEGSLAGRDVIWKRDDAQATGFAPDSPSDGRPPGDWMSRYPKPAQKQIIGETIYLLVLLYMAPLVMVFLNTGLLKTLFRFNDEQYRPFLTFGLAWLGGLLGGTLFDIKWLYHVVARDRWNRDRVYWRVLTPHVSAGLAFGTMALIASGIFRILDPATVNSKTLVVAVSFLVGYFSDSAVSKLA
jgi:hypothetical protein